MKRWFESKTVWFNIITGLVSLAVVLMEALDKLALTEFQATLAAIILTAFINIGNLVLRMITTKAIQ